VFPELKRTFCGKIFDDVEIIEHSATLQLLENPKLNFRFSTSSGRERGEVLCAEGV
jgi:hypothetical protein